MKMRRIVLLRWYYREHSSIPEWKATVSFHHDWWRTGTQREFRLVGRHVIYLDGWKRRQGTGYAYIPLPTEYVNGKTIHLTGWIRSTWAPGSIQILLLDGAYDRTNDADFPVGASLPLKGAGVIQTLMSKPDYHNDDGEPFDVTVQIDTTAATLPTCTLLCRIINTTDGEVSLLLHSFELLDSDGTLIAEEGFSSDRVLEHFNPPIYDSRPDNLPNGYDTTGSDWGYMSTGEVTPPPPPPVKYHLTLNSSPISPVDITVDGTVVQTPQTLEFDEGQSITVIAPTEVQTTGARYIFDHWVMGAEIISENQTTLVIDADTTLTAVYTLYEPPPPVTHRLSIISTPIPITFNLTKVE